jgi:DNA polymerase III delta prime subunit
MLDSALYDPMTPTKVGDIVGNAEVWGPLYEQIQAQTTGHLVCVGPAGCGKSLFFRLALKGYQVLHIDCTANSGLRDVRETLRVFARGSKAATKLRWIVLEQADALSSDTQAFLRRCLETTAGSTRVAFLCRDAGAISEPLLSRTTLVSVDSPDDTEVVYELLRRTEFKVDRKQIEEVASRSYGNLRGALTEALAARHCGHAFVSGIAELLSSRPPVEKDTDKDKDSAWAAWALRTVRTCKDEGYDLRDVLRGGWPRHPVVAQACAAWSRLGGTSPRALFFASIAKLRTATASSV